MKTIAALAVVASLTGLVQPAGAEERKIQEISITEVDESEVAWAEIEGPVRGRETPRDSRAGARAGDEKSRSDRQGLVERAARLQAFAEQHPKSPRVTEARQQEALALLQAALFGDDEGMVRREALVAEIRSDTSVPRLQQYQVVALAANLAVFRRTYASLEEFVAAQEKVARALIAEFPDLETPYESLLGLASSASAEHGREVATEILTMSCPESVKAKARGLLAESNPTASNRRE